MRAASFAFSLLVLLPCRVHAQDPRPRPRASGDAWAAWLDRADPVQDARAARAIGDRRLLSISGVGYWVTPGLPDEPDAVSGKVAGFGSDLLVGYQWPDSTYSDATRRRAAAARSYAERYNRELLRDTLVVPARRAPEIRGVLCEGFYSPSRAFAGVRVAVRFTASPRCEGATGADVLTDSLGAFRIGPQERPTAAAVSVGASPLLDWWLCLEVPFSRESLWMLYRIPAMPPASVQVDCVGHGEGGGPECTAVRTLPRTTRGRARGG